MTDETQSTTQKLLELIVNQSKVINRLQAFNTIHTFALIELLKRAESFTDTQDEIATAYEEARGYAQQLIALADNAEGFEQFLALTDKKFMAIYE